MMFPQLDRYRDHGLLLLRVGIGISFMLHGFPKLQGGPELWTGLGSALGALGIHFAPTFMGFMAASAEFFGGLFLALGLFTRPAVFFMLNTMIVAMAMHLSKGDSFMMYSHALEAGILFLSMILIGPGRFSLDAYCPLLRKRRQRASNQKPIDVSHDTALS